MITSTTVLAINNGFAQGPLRPQALPRSPAQHLNICRVNPCWRSSRINIYQEPDDNTMCKYNVYM